VYPVGATVFRPVENACPMPLDGPGHLDDLWDPAGVGVLAITRIHLQRAVLGGLRSVGGEAAGT